ncbi:hypothetical protein GLYMA_13G258951v4 [Glycine max]|nr:hypothetical protein GLYMA_13G258951v4 [Glycine max]
MLFSSLFCWFCCSKLLHGFATSPMRKYPTY